MNDITEVPTEQFARHILPLCLEGEILWEVDDEVKDDISYNDLADPSNLEDVVITDDEVRLFGTVSTSVSEKVASSTRWEPAEYKNHDVTVLYTATMPWPTEDYQMPTGDVLVEQDSYPTAPPSPDVHEHKYDL